MVLIINQFKILIDNVKYKLFGEHLNVSDERFQTILLKIAILLGKAAYLVYYLGRWFICFSVIRRDLVLQNLETNLIYLNDLGITFEY